MSVNSSSNHIAYEKELLDLMKAKYPLPQGQKTFYNRMDRLYVQLIYICKNRCDRDIDNILKYIIDSFSKYLYKDDKQIGYVLSQSIICKDNEMTGLSLSWFEEEIAEKIYDFLQSNDRNRKSCTYFECGVMNEKFYHFNLEQLWK